MRALMIAAAVAALTCSISAPSYAQTSQQALMKSCNTDAAAKKLKGDARKSFMADCLAGKAAETPAGQPAATAQAPQANQQQRMKECNANATSQKLKGTARKDFMSSCLSGGTAASAPAAAPSSTTAAAPAAQTTAQSPQASQQQRMKECNANATSQKLKGTARKDFMSSCLSGSSAASTSSTSIPPVTNAPNPQAPAATRTTVAPGAPVQPKQPTTSGSAPATAALGPGQYATEAQAKSTCASDTVVWVNTESHIYHFKNASDYGKTKQGAYMCEREAVAGGSRAAKNEKRS